MDSAPEQPIVLDTRQVAIPIAEPAAVEYMRRKLESGIGLGEAVAPSLPFQRGTYSAVVPTGTEPSRTLRFGSGGLARVGSSLLAATQIILEVLRTNQGAVLITEQILESPESDIFAQRRQPSHRVIGGHAYHLLPGEDATLDTLYYILGLSDSGFSLNAVVGRDPGLSSDDGEDFDRYLRAAVDRPELVMVRAYDGEGFVLWRHNPAAMQVQKFWKN